MSFTRRCLFALLWLRLFLPGVVAQEEMPPEPRPHGEYNGDSELGHAEGYHLAEGERPPPPPREDFFAPHGKGPKGGPHLEKWLRHLEERDPEEFARFRRLREDDPELFRREMAQRFRREHARTRLQSVPRLHDYLMGLPPAERDEILNQFAEGDAGFGRGRGRHHPEIQRLEGEARQLADDYRRAGESEQPRLREELRAVLARTFDEREAERARTIEQMEKKLTGLKARLQERGGKRDEIVERRFQELTEGDPLAW